MENDIKKTGTDKPMVEKVMERFDLDSAATSGFWKSAVSFLGFALGLGSGYLFFAVAKDKQIKILSQQVEELKKQNEHYKEKFKKEKKRYETLISEQQQFKNGHSLGEKRNGLLLLD